MDNELPRGCSSRDEPSGASYTDDQLFEKIKYCVSFDLIGDGKFVEYDRMTAVNKIRFQKQCDRLYFTCVREPSNRGYIEDRFAGIKLYK